MPGLQNWIHALEEGRGVKITRVFLAVFAFIALALVYNFLCFKNFHLPEAMDSAQLARNLSEGKGYTTDYVRPLSIHLLQEHRADRNPLLKTAHPDLANAPVYPALLAGLFKVAPIKFSIPSKSTFITYSPELWIAGLNQFLFFCAILLTFFLACRLFTPIVGWISALVLAGTELLWQFSVSGLPTMLLLVLVLGAVSCLVRLDECHRAETVSSKKMLGLGISAGVLIGLAGLTRYSFLWLILPTLIFVALFTPRYRIKTFFVVLFSFLIVVTPWLVRNASASGTLFGTSTYAIVSGTPAFPEDSLERSLAPDFDKVTIKNLGSKLFGNAHNSVKNQIPTLGGSWVAAFFLVGLLVPFQNPMASRLRIFLLASLALFLVVQSLARSSVGDTAKEISPENLLIVFVPLVFIFGSAFGNALLGPIKLLHPAKIQILAGVFIVLVSAPLVFALFPPRTFASAYPPYYPPMIQEGGSWMKESELMMSDVPWAVAWYGDRQCVTLPLEQSKDFFTINDDLKPVQALYLSSQTTDGRFLTQILHPKSWEQFDFQVVTRGEAALKDFPLKSVYPKWMPRDLFLTDWERWKMARK